MGTARGRLLWFGRIWLILASTFVVAGLLDLAMLKGWSAVWDFLNPANVFNWLVIGLTLAPGLFAFRAPAGARPHRNDLPAPGKNAINGHA